MSTTNVELSLDDIIKNSRKEKRLSKNGKGGGRKGNVGKPGKKFQGKKGQAAPKKGQNAVKNGQLKALVNDPATKRLVQTLVNKELAKREKASGGRVIRKFVKTNGSGNNKRISIKGISQRSHVIKRSPRTETVVVRRVVAKPQPRQVVREVIVQEPVRQRVVRAPAVNSRIVYVQKQGSSFGGTSRRRFITKRRQNTDPFYEPQNYLQRIPAEGTRYIQQY